MSDIGRGVEAILEAILRGAVKLLGCDSANMAQFDEEQRAVRVRVGAMAGSLEALDQLEGLLGGLKNLTVSFESIEDGLAFAAWRDGTVQETSSIRELAGSLFGADVAGLAMALLGEHRFALVPVYSGSRRYGIIIFEKLGGNPFSPQQRELFVRYAQRIGEILHSSGRPGADGTQERDLAASTSVLRMLVDANGAIVGGSCTGALGDRTFGAEGPPDDGPASRPWILDACRRAADMLHSGISRIGPITLDPASVAPGSADHCLTLVAEWGLIPVEARSLVLVSLHDTGSMGDPSHQRLVRIALGRMSAAIMVDPDLCITSVNEAVTPLFGYRPDEIMSKSISALFGEPADIQGILDRQTLFLTRGYVEERAVLRRRDGSTFQGDVGALLLADEADHVIGFLVRMRERPESRQEPGGESEAIERLMKRERLATMGELAAQLAHEIRNPLVAIGATLESLSRDHEADQELAETLDMVRGEITRMDMILRDYLSMTVRQNASAGRVDLADLLSQLHRLLRTSPKANGKTLEMAIPKGLKVLGDSEGLRHVVFNLIVNALEAIPAGASVRCRGEAFEGGVRLFVDDDGPGLAVPPESCFEPFFTTKKNGTGLGLSVSRKILASHGGTITLENRQGGGCRATVTLPMGGVP
jgi:PAS domain S-box-containing protein